MRGVCIFILSCIVFSCMNLTEPVEFGVELDYFPIGFVDHFPSEVPIIYFTSVSENITYSHPYVWLKTEYSDAEIRQLTSKLDSIAVAIYSNDTCLLTIDKHIEYSNWRKYNKTSKSSKYILEEQDSCYENKIPIPKFYVSGWYDDTTKPTGLSNYKYYVLAGERGQFLELDKLPNAMYSPKNWPHGISRGVAINEDSGETIYWADIW